MKPLLNPVHYIQEKERKVDPSEELICRYNLRGERKPRPRITRQKPSKRQASPFSIHDRWEQVFRLPDNLSEDDRVRLQMIFAVAKYQMKCMAASKVLYDYVGLKATDYEKLDFSKDDF